MTGKQGCLMNFCQLKWAKLQPVHSLKLSGEKQTIIKQQKIVTMTIVRYNNKLNANPAFNNLLSDLLPHTSSMYREQHKSVPVNIREAENEYILEVVTPGWNREDFTISLDNDLLTVSAEKKEETVNQNEKFVRREYKQSSFKRSFTVDEKINAEAISAQYVNGVLTLNLPKKEEVKPATKQITIQ